LELFLVANYSFLPLLWWLLELNLEFEAGEVIEWSLEDVVFVRDDFFDLLVVVLSICILKLAS